MYLKAQPIKLVPTRREQQYFYIEI